MIANITTGNNVHQMVMYNANKLYDKNEDKKAQYLGSQNISSNITKDIIQAIVNRNNRNVSVEEPNIHVSLNFPAGELIDNNKMILIANRYMELMNYGDQPYAIYRHYDRNHPHIHIVSTQIDLAGKKISDSHIFRRSVSNSRKIEKEFNLISAIKSKKKIELDVNNNKGVIDYINISLRNILFKKPINYNQLDKELLSLGIKRVEKEGGHYFQLDEVYSTEFKENSNIYKVSDLDLLYNNDFFQNEFKKNNNEKNYFRKQVQAKIYSLTSNIKEPIKLEELQTLFNKKGLRLIPDTIKYGENINRINKLFIVDVNSGITYSASDLNIRTKSFLNKYVIVDDHNLNPEDQEVHSIGSEGNPYYEDPSLFDFSNILLSGVIDLMSKITANDDENILLKNKRKKRRKK